MSTATKASVSHLAYKKIVLHCAKYPSGRVFGFLVGTKSAQAVDVVDAIPLSHHWTSLSPMAEAGLSLVSAFVRDFSCKSDVLTLIAVSVLQAVSYAASKGLKIVGLYEAPELLGHRTPSAQASKLTEKIATLLSSDALLFLVNNATLLSANDHSLVPYTVAPSSTSGNKGTNNSAKEEAKPKSLSSGSVTLKQTARAKELEDDVRKTRVWDRLHDFDGTLLPPHLTC